MLFAMRQDHSYARTSNWKENFHNGRHFFFGPIYFMFQWRRQTFGWGGARSWIFIFGVVFWGARTIHLVWGRNRIDLLCSIIFCLSFTYILLKHKYAKYKFKTWLKCRPITVHNNQSITSSDLAVWKYGASSCPSRIWVLDALVLYMHYS